MATLFDFLGAVLQAALYKPYLLFPFFILEEFGVPFPWLLSGLFVYAGYRLSQGDWIVLWMVPVNLSGGLIGASIVYWLSRRGLLGLLGRFRRYVLLDDASLSRIQPRIQRWGPVAVLVARFLPIPMPVTSLASGLFRIPFLSFLLFIALSNLIWNTLYMSGGVLTGHALSYFLRDLSRTPYLILIPALVLISGFALAVVKFRRRPKARDETRAA